MELTIKEYAKSKGISVRTVFNRMRNGELAVKRYSKRDVRIVAESYAVYVRVAPNEVNTIEEQVSRLINYANANGISVAKIYKEISSSVSDERPELINLLNNENITHILIDNPVRLSRFGYKWIEMLSKAHHKIIVVANPAYIEVKDAIFDLNDAVERLSSDLKQFDVVVSCDISQQ